MAKKKPIRVIVKQTPFGLCPEIIGGSKKSRQKASDIIFYTLLFEGPFGSGHHYTAKEWEDILNEKINVQRTEK